MVFNLERNIFAKSFAVDARGPRPTSEKKRAGARRMRKEQADERESQRAKESTKKRRQLKEWSTKENINKN